MKVYIAGPYSRGDKEQNTINAMQAAEELVSMGHIPYIPHLTHYWDLKFQHPYKFWLYYDKQWLLYCDAILRLPGESSGADSEVDIAVMTDKPVYYTISSMPKGTANFQE